MRIDFSEINLAANIVNMGTAVVQAVIIALLTSYFLNRVFLKERAIGKRLREYGIERIGSGTGGMLSRRDRGILFGYNGHTPPTEVDLCFITGKSFFEDFQEKVPLLEHLADGGCKIKVLLASPNEGYVTQYIGQDGIDPAKMDDVVDYYCRMLEGAEGASFLERSFTMLSAGKVDMTAPGQERREQVRRLLLEYGDHISHVKHIRQVLAQANASGNIELRFYIDEYQMPIIMAKYPAHGRRNAKILLWTNINAPIKETKESINVSAAQGEDEPADFVSDVERSFFYLWDRYAPKG